ncbi:glycosyltransferase family 4 protein [Candidatus Daviesbacteria bacterium]|nr:glycosyltransferase family 4 protein [Candidatus Daviesbacteria bacterium]
MIKVGLDISQIAHGGGVATYTQNLAEQLQELTDLEMVYFYSSLRKPYRGGLKNIKKYRLPPTLFEMLFNRWRNVPIEKFIGPLDVFHSSDWTQPPSKAKRVTTYHDVVPLKYPQWSHPKIVEVHKRRLWLVEKEIDFVIAVSEATKKDLMEVSVIPESKIKVIYEGPTGNFQKASKIQIKEFRIKYNLPEKFVLAIGGIGERRNLERIKEASTDYYLVVAGNTIPRLDINELGLLYQSASVLAYCSLYEGFGLPIVDAFYCGLPVVTSDVSSMVEIAGGAALLADPLSTEDIREKIKIAIEDEEEAENLIKKGFERANFFSWKKCAKETAEVYRRLVEK